MPDDGPKPNRKLTIDFLTQLARDAYARQAPRWSPDTPADATHIPARVRVIALGLALAITVALCIGGALLMGYSL